MVVVSRGDAGRGHKRVFAEACVWKYGFLFFARALIYSYVCLPPPHARPNPSIHPSPNPSPNPHANPGWSADRGFRARL